MPSRRLLLLLLLASLAASTLAFAPARTGSDQSTTTGVVWGTSTDTTTFCDGFEDASFCTGASEQGDPGGEEPELFGPCDQTEGVTTVTPADGFDDVVPTPTGAAYLTEPTDAALIQVSLEGFEVGTTARMRFELDWDLPAPVGDYDLNINGENDFSTDQPEVETLTGGHCAFFDVATEVFTGTPVDTLTLTVEATPVG